MFNTTLRYLSLIILPHPSFDVPVSEADPVFRIHRGKRDNDTSYISQDQISQFGPIEFSTPRKPMLRANSSPKRRRDTICCYSCHCLADPCPAKEDIPRWPVNTSFNSFLSSDTFRHNLFHESVLAPSTSARFEIVAPQDPPSLSSSRAGQPRVTSFVDFSDSSDDRVTPIRARNERKNTSKGKEKHSAPPAVSLDKDQFSLQNYGVINITSTDKSIQPPDKSQPHPTLLRKDQRQKPHGSSISPYTSKQFEIGLSPIIEDTYTFVNTLRSPKNMERKPAIDMVDSSESSYGELIQKKTISYLSTSEYETFGGLEWENRGRSKQPTRFDKQNCAELQRDRYWSDEFWETFENSSLIPELTFTSPTPEMGISARFHQPSELSYGGGFDCQRSEEIFVPESTNTCRPNRLGYTTALASISKALGTGAGMLLGVGNGIFDDMLEAGVISNGTSQLSVPTVVHARDHLGDGFLGSLTTQPSGEDETETGFLRKLLRQKSTGRSRISEHSGRSWQRVSRIFRFSRTSSGSARDQEKPSVSVSASSGPSDGTNGPLNTSRVWKRLSRILTNATYSSRRRSAGDQVQFTEFAEGGHGGHSDSGSTRRHGLDIPSDSAEHIGEHWSPGMARPLYINEKHAATRLDQPTDTTIGTSRR